MSPEPHNFLIIQPYRFGDVLQMTPTLQALKNQRPGCRIDFLVSAECAEVLDGNPHCDEIIAVPQAWFSGNRPRPEWAPVLADLRGRKYDLVVNRFSSQMGAALASSVSAAAMAGMHLSAAEALTIADLPSQYLTGAVKDLRFNPFNFIDLGNAMAGAVPAQPGVVFQPPVQAENKVNTFLSSNRLFERPPVVLQVAASTPEKMLDEAALKRVLELLLPHLAVVLVGGPGEQARLQTLAREDLAHPAVIWAGLSWSELQALVQKARLFVTPDTGPMHLVASTQTPILAYFLGSNSPFETAPYSAHATVLSATPTCSRDGVNNLDPEFSAALILHTVDPAQPKPGLRRAPAMFRTHWAGKRLTLDPVAGLTDNAWQQRLCAQTYWEPRIFNHPADAEQARVCASEYREALKSFVGWCDGAIKHANSPSRRVALGQRLQDLKDGTSFLAKPLLAMLQFAPGEPFKHEAIFCAVIQQERKHAVEALKIADA